MSSSLLAQNTGSFGGDNLELGSVLTLKDGRTVREAFSTPADMVNLLIPNLFVLAGVILFIMIIVSGYKFITQGEKGIQEAKSIMGIAGAGFIIMFSAYWIVQIIKILTGADIPL